MSMAAPKERVDNYVLKSWLDAAVVIDEKLHGPLPDVVRTQGYYLKPRPHTPVYERGYDPQFIRNLEFSLDGLLFVQKLRRRKYGEDAEEWPPSHTPVELKEQWEAEQETEERRVQALLEIPTPEDDPAVRELPSIMTQKRSLNDVSSSSNSSPPATSRKRLRTSSPCDSHDYEYMRQDPACVLPETAPGKTPTILLNSFKAPQKAFCSWAPPQLHSTHSHDRPNNTRNASVRKRVQLLGKRKPLHNMAVGSALRAKRRKTRPPLSI